MRKAFFIFGILLLLTKVEFTFAQGECLTGGCTANTNETKYLRPAGLQSTLSDVFVVVANNLREGDFARYEVTAGSTYEWSLCGADGGYVQFYDASLTLYNDADLIPICFSDNYCNTNRPKIRWTATFTGTARVQVNDRNGGVCNSWTFFSFENTVLVWRCVDCSVDCAAEISYPGPFCVDNSTTQMPIIIGSTSGTYSTSPVGLNLNTTTGAILPSASTPGIYTVTYAIPEIGSCPAIDLTETVVITALPATPTLSPNPACAGSNINFEAGDGSLYEFFVNDVSQAPMSSNSSFNSAPLNADDEVCVRSYPTIPFVMDGNIIEPEWGNALANSTSGPASGFAGNNRIDAIYLKNVRGTLYGALAGNENDGNDQANNNWILIFIDSKPGGFNSLISWTNRDNVPGFTQGVKNLALNDDVIFDPGFEPDYILTMNQADATAYFDLYDMQADFNTFLGSNVDGSNNFGFIENSGIGDFTKGFEFSFPLDLIGSPSNNLDVFVMMINDPNTGEQTFLSNQFLTRANEDETSYGNAYIDFGNAAPDPFTFNLSSDCFTETCVTASPSVSPITSFSYDTPVCEGDLNILPDFATEFTTGGNYSILPASGLVINSSTREIDLTNSTPGTYNITYTVTASGCNPEGTTSFEIIINPLPTTTNIYHD